MRNSKPILLVEDDEVDALTIQKALAELKVSNKIVHKFNGREAMEYLRDENNHTPCIILLDIEMPQMDGFEFISTVKSQERLKKIPTVILAASDGDETVTKAFEWSAAGYIVKTVDFGQFVETMRIVNNYWTLSRLPNSN